MSSRSPLLPRADCWHWLPPSPIWSPPPSTWSIPLCNCHTLLWRDTRGPYQPWTFFPAPPRSRRCRHTPCLHCNRCHHILSIAVVVVVVVNIRLRREAKILIERRSWRRNEEITKLWTHLFAAAPLLSPLYPPPPAWWRSLSIGNLHRYDIGRLLGLKDE